MQERQRFNIFKAIKDIFRPRVEQKVEKSQKNHTKLRSSQTKKKVRSNFSRVVNMPSGTPKLFLKMARANARETNLKRVQMIGVVRRLASMESAEKVTPGRFTRAIREHREWLAQRGAR